MDHPPPSTQPITLPATSVIQLAGLLTTIDEFLRSSSLIPDDLAGFLGNQSRHPRIDACELIDQTSFTAAHLRQLTNGTGPQAAQHTHLAGYDSPSHQNNP